MREARVLQQTVGLRIKGLDAGRYAIKERDVAASSKSYLEVSGVSACEFLIELVNVKI
jgi:hypothetical protein